jgi:hypothetical protein
VSQKLSIQALTELTNFNSNDVIPYQIVGDSGIGEQSLVESRSCWSS